jgi:2-methylisocitrate lyase-like PEP mutase family enzyme
MATSQADKAARFRALHNQTFVIPNPWDAASARLLQGLGFSALATSSAAAAGRLGRRDYELTREEALANAREIVEVTDIPVSADLENGFGDSPEAVRETVRRAAEIGLAGCSIEDAPGDGAAYPLALAVERVAAAVEIVRSLSCPFVLTARAENFVRGSRDLDDTIRRLQAYADVGADVVFAPGVADRESLRRLCASVSKPVNVMAGIKGQTLTVTDLGGLGVKRVSLAASLFRAAMTAVRDAAIEVRDAGTFSFVDRALTTVEFNDLAARPGSIE